jgi:hypothetical protein
MTASKPDSVSLNGNSARFVSFVLWVRLRGGEATSEMMKKKFINGDAERLLWSLLGIKTQTNIWPSANSGKATAVAE